MTVKADEAEADEGRGERDVTDVERQAEEKTEQGGAAEHESEKEIAGQGAEVVADVIRHALQPVLAEQSLIHSGAVIYAAIAGVCLFVAGLISGYFDNYAAYNRIPQRIRQLSWARRLLGDYRLQRVSNYVGDNLGALSGNFLFGFMLGGTTLLGFLFGLPLDIRHVAFSSAFVGLGFVGLDGHPDLWLLLWAVLGVAAIGTINLVVSFSLALNVALRSRQVSGTPWKTIAGAVWRHLRQRPRDFFLPPKDSAG